MHLTGCAHKALAAKQLSAEGSNADGTSRAFDVRWHVSHLEDYAKALIEPFMGKPYFMQDKSRVTT